MTSNRQTPIQELADRLPSKFMDELKAVHDAGESMEHASQLKHLDRLRRHVSTEQSSPDLARTGQKMNLTIALGLIDAMRESASTMLSRSQTARAFVAQDAALTNEVPASALQGITNCKAICDTLGPEMSHAAAVLFHRIQIASRQGAFAVAADFCERFSTTLCVQPNFIEQHGAARINQIQELAIQSSREFRSIHNASIQSQAAAAGVQPGGPSNAAVTPPLAPSAGAPISASLPKTSFQWMKGLQREPEKSVSSRLRPH